ncbi:hypothetical protein FHX82_003029 [Amycolatopsis bartoniae]|uniref:Uncharacterized protein n=1 Tax=Amycolatopsis bartoniae TaxID=941986 RepID=A0A8H9MEN1_9PSEU|nr:hypothetical protein [Amycolatopsis bartoniae]MBB2935975.1 hypothetical protein [Amycolatopsis bartoniae]TVT01130.1 hypothetical protein FNH07_30240 [Amycolatopsis bartoniae]GHF63208.1 hypothetical protein GCM10017566_41030 [Amycolatopsis bartoniae]
MSREEARPGRVGGFRRAGGTLFAALYGQLLPHPGNNPDPDRDVYIRFHDRALAMGWLDDGVAGLWGMNDAGREHPLAVPGSSLVAWFQVGVEPVPGDRPLPVQPFLRCAGDVLARLGDLRLWTVQVLLPVQALDTAARPEAARMPSLRTAAWFDDGGPRSGTPVLVTLDGRQSPARLREEMDRLDQDVFVCEPSVDPGPPPAPPLPDHLWRPGHRVTFGGTLAEWSLDAIGWLGGFLADLSARRGVGTPLLLTVSRRES